MATGLTFPMTLNTSWQTAQSAQFWAHDFDRRIHAKLLVGRPDGYTWEDLSSYLVRAEVELGDVSGVGTGGTGADAVVRRMKFDLQPEGMLIPAWPEDTAQDESYVVGDESDVIGDEQDSAALLIDRLFGTTHKYARNGFSPRDQNSAWNQFKGEFAPIVKPNREVALLAAVTPPGEEPTSLDWVTLFHGFIDRTSTPGSNVSVECRDLAKRLMYTYIYEQEEFGDDDNPVPAHIVIQQILNRYVTTYTPQLWVPKQPTFTCGRFRTQYESVWDAIQKVTAQFGWFLGYRWVPALSAFRLVLMEPPRLKTAGSADFILSHVKNIYDHTDEIGDEYIGNVAVIEFTEKSTKERKTVVVRNQESIDEWEERAMQFSEGELSLIDTEEEAIALGTAAVTDCGGIIGAKRIIAPFLPTADVFTGVVVDDPRISSTEDFTGVVSVRHMLDFDAKVFETEMVGQSRVVGGDKRWRKMLTRPGAKPPLSSVDLRGTSGRVVPTPTGLVAKTGTGQVVSLDWDDLPESNFVEYGVYRNTTDSFSGAVKIAEVSASRFVDVDVSIATTYWYWVTAIDVGENESEPTTSANATPGAISDAEISQEILDAIQQAQDTADRKVTIYFQDDPPTGDHLQENDLWYDTNDGNKPYRRDGSQWQPAQDAAISAAAAAALAAQNTADRKVQTFYQTTAPDPEEDELGEGDIWYDTDDGNKPYRWDASGEAWVGIAANSTPSNPTAATKSGEGSYLSTDGTTLAYLEFSVPALPTGAAYQNVVYRKQGSSGWQIADQLTNSTTATVRIDDLTPGIEYDVATVAVSTYGVQSSIVSATSSPFLAPGDTTAPATPNAPTVTSAIRGLIVDVTTPNTEADLAGYEVHVSTTSGFTPGSGTLKATISAKANEKVRLDVVDLTPGETYFVKLKAFDRSGNVSDASNQGSAVAGVANRPDVAQDAFFVITGNAESIRRAWGATGIVQVLDVSVPAGKKLSFKRIRYHLGLDSTFRMTVQCRVSGSIAGTWTSSAHKGEAAPNTTLADNSMGGSPITAALTILVASTSPSDPRIVTTVYGPTWWLDMAIE